VANAMRPGLGGWETLKVGWGRVNVQRGWRIWGCFWMFIFRFQGEGASWRSANENQETLVPSCPSAMHPWHSVTMILKAAWSSRAGFSSPFAIWLSQWLAPLIWQLLGDGSKSAPYPHGFRSNLGSSHRLSIWIFDVFGIPSGLTSSHLQLV
jgi:hypothetical protein